MDFPRTPIRAGKRYGPSLAGVGVGGDDLRKRVQLGGGSGFEGAASSSSYSGFLSQSSNVSYSYSLVERALAAIEKAEKRGDTHVDMEEREWEAWQQWTKEQEIEREVQRRLAMEKEKWLKENQRRIVTIPTPALTPSSSGLSGSTAKRKSVDLSSISAPGAPGFLVGDRFTSISGSGSTSSLTSLSGSSARYPDVISSTASSTPRSVTPRPNTPPSLLPGTLLVSDEDDDVYDNDIIDDDLVPALSPLTNRPIPISTRRRPVSSSSPSLSSASVSASVSSSVPSVRRFAPREILDDEETQPGRSYHPGLHPSLRIGRREVEVVEDEEEVGMRGVRRVVPGGFR